MKHLIASALIVVLMIGIWIGFDTYSERRINEITSSITEELIPAVEKENWETGLDLIAENHESWIRFRNVAFLFLENDIIRDIDSAMAKVTEYIKAEDVSNSSGELSYICQQLTTIDEQERITFYNIL